MSKPLLEVIGLRRIFGAEPQLGVLHADLCLQESEKVSIVGSSGSGKSTLLSMLAGLQRPDCGSILFAGRNLWELTTRERCRIRQHQICFISQFTSLIESLTTLDNLLLAQRLSGVDFSPSSRDQVYQCLERVDLKEQANTPAKFLSGGEVRRAIFARAMLSEPKLILADEPTSNLDSQMEQNLFDLLIDICQQSDSALIVVTHNVSLADRLDRRLTLEDGILHGDPTHNPPRAESQPQLEQNKSLVLFSRRALLIGSVLSLVSVPVWIERNAQRLRNKSLLERSKLERLTFSGLGTELVDIKLDRKDMYIGSVTIDNLDVTQDLFLLPTNVEIFVQAGTAWSPFPAVWSLSSQSVVHVDRQRVLTFEFSDLPEKYTELVPGYLHVRINLTYLIANSPQPQYSPLERRDSFFVYLLPINPNPERLELNHFPGQPPLFIPMPPH